MEDIDRSEGEQLLLAAAVPLVRIEASGRISMMNDPAIAVLGADFSGRHFTAAFRDPTVTGVIEVALTGGDAGEAVVERHVQGQPRQFKVSVVPLTSGGVLLTQVDSSAEIAASQSRSEFVANVSHELRTPLTAISGMIETLKGQARNDPEAQEAFLNLMEGEAARMKNLVADLLSLSQVENEGLYRWESLDLCALIKSAKTSLGEPASKRNVTIALKGCDDERTVMGDADKLRQVLNNLLENAIKYGATDSEVTVDISEPVFQAILGKTGVRIDVRDHGEGIAEDHLARVTERFFRVDDHRARDTGGTGLGLAIVKHIVNRHHGRLRIESKRGSGSCFSVFLPTD